MTGWMIASQQYVAHGSKAAGRGIIALIFVFMFFHTFAGTVLLIGSVVEISPFHLRSRYLTVMLLAVAAGSFFSSYVDPVTLEAIQWKYRLSCIIWLAI